MDLFNRTPAAQKLRERMKKLDFIKFKSFCITKEMFAKLKRVEENTCNYTSDKGLITRIYRELKKINSPKINEPIKKWTIELYRTCSKEGIQMAKKYMKKCSPSMAIKEMQTKTTLRFHLTTVRLAIIKNTTTNRYW
jgi:hypothetical protein